MAVVLLLTAPHSRCCIHIRVFWGALCSLSKDKFTAPL